LTQINTGEEARNPLAGRRRMLSAMQFTRLNGFNSIPSATGAIRATGMCLPAVRLEVRTRKINNEGVRRRFSMQHGTAVTALDYVDVDWHADRHQIEFWLVTAPSCACSGAEAPGADPPPGVDR